MANHGPGAHDPHKPFGAELNNISFGSKYKFKPDENPPAGLYDPETANRHVKPRIRAAIIKEDKSFAVPRENSPAPG